MFMHDSGNVSRCPVTEKSVAFIFLRVGRLP